MRLLDLFCGAGGAAMGYSRAGFTDIVGVDSAPQKHYPFAFVQADALEYVAAHGRDFDFIHASPPCQAYSKLTPQAYKANHPDLILSVSALLRSIGKPYVVENVSGARHLLNAPLLLCGSMFGLPIFRHRFFECSFTMLSFSCAHDFLPILISGTIRRKGQKRTEPSVSIRKKAMGIDWMSGRELDQAVPPAYTEFIGNHFLSQPATRKAEEQ